MNRGWTSRRRRLGLWGILPALCLVLTALPAPARAAGPTITSFYSVSKATYDNWQPSDGPAPVMAGYPPNVAEVAFYFKYANTTPNSDTFQIILKDSHGQNAGTGKVHSFTDRGGSELISFSGGFSNGSYSADLLIDGSVTAITSFTVGAVTPPAPNPRTTPVHLIKAYPISRTAYDAWDPNSNSDPPATTVFSAGSQEVGIFFSYDHARPTVDTFQLILTAPDGSHIGTGKIHPFHYAAGAEALILPLDTGVTLGPGAYRAILLIDGAPGRQMPWTVGGGNLPAPTPQPVQPIGPPVIVKHCHAADLEAVVRCDEPSVLRVGVTLADGEAQGTSFVIRVDSTGTYLLTNRHVVEGGSANAIKIYAPDGSLIAKHALAIRVNAGKPGTAGDLAVIRIQPTSLRPLAFGNSDLLGAGETVASIGYGLAFELAGPPSVTEGIISAIHRDLSDGYGPVWIQHQSTINHGNSGGPLVDLHGDVVGVNTLSVDQLPGQNGKPEPVQGIFFAIPANMAHTVANSLIASMESGGALAGSQAPTTNANLFQGKHFTVALPPGWSVKGATSGNPLFIARDQLVQMSIHDQALRGQPMSRTDLALLAHDAGIGFGKLKNMAVSDATVGTLHGILAAETFSDNNSHLDLYLLADPSNTYLFVLARVTESGAAAADTQQSIQIINSLRETR